MGVVLIKSGDGYNVRIIYFMNEIVAGLLRDGNKEEFKKQIRAALLSIDIEEYSDDYSIQFNEDTTLYFTQTHIAEIQEILRLLAEYGAPAEEEDENEVGYGRIR